MRISPKQYAQFLYAITKDAKGAELIKQAKMFIDLLMRNRALPLLPRIERAYVDYYNTREEVHDATVISARELPARALKQLREALKDQNVECQSQIDPEVLGGARIRVGDYMIDDTLKARLAQLKKAMYGR